MLLWLAKTSYKKEKGFQHKCPKKGPHQPKCTHFLYITKMPAKVKKNYLRTTYINISYVTWSNPLLQLPHFHMQISAATQLLILLVLQKNKIDSSIIYKNHQNQTEKQQIFILKIIFFKSDPTSIQ